MYKIIIILYVICFSLYILFSREPDFFDGEFANAKIHFTKDSNNAIIPKAFFSNGYKTFAIDARYTFRNLFEGENIKVIYENEQPQNAVVYSVWGYWLRWKELLASIILIAVLYQISVLITSRPSPEGLISDIESSMPKKRKYH